MSERDVEATFREVRALRHDLRTAVSLIRLQLDLLSRRLEAAPEARDTLRKVRAETDSILALTDRLGTLFPAPGPESERGPAE